MKWTTRSEYEIDASGIEACSECGHPWDADGPGHDPDCRYYWHEEEAAEWDADPSPDVVRIQLSLFKTAA